MVDALRRSCKNNIHMSAKILGTPSIRMLTGMCLFVVRPARLAFGTMLKDVKTQSGCVRWWAAMANKEWIQELLDDVNSLCSEDNIRLARYSTAEHDVDTNVGELCARYHLDFVISTLGCRLVTLTSFSFTLPNYFGALLSEKPMAVDECLRNLAAWWDKLQELEAAGKGNPFFCKFAQGCVWPMLSWCREVLVILSEYDFKEVPEWLALQYLLPWARGFHGTSLSEDGFQLLRRSEGVAETRRLGRTKRWAILANSSLLQDYDRSPPPITLVVRQAAGASQGFPKKMFEAASCKTSLSKEELNEVVSGRATPSPESFAELHCAWMAALQVQHITDLQKAWLSAMMQKGTIVKNSSKIGVLLVHVTSWGVFVWKLTIKQVGANHCFQLMAKEDSWLFVPVTDCDGWRVVAVETMTPRCALELGLWHADGSHPGMWFAAQGVPEPLVKYAAKLGFPGMSLPLLQKLLAVTKQTFATGKRPRSETDVLKALLAFHLPGLTTAEVAIVLERRSGKMHEAAPLPSQLLQGAHMKMAKDVLDDDEADDIEQDVEKLKAKVQRATARSGASSSAPGAGAVAKAPAQQPAPAEAQVSASSSSSGAPRPSPLVRGGFSVY